LIFIKLDMGVPVFSAAVFDSHAMPVHGTLGHSALSAVLIVLVRQAPGKKLAHAVMQMNGSPHGSGKIDEG
jgi:hypothetical protein